MIKKGKTISNLQKIGCESNMQRGERKRKTNRREVYERNEELQTRKTRECKINKREDKQKGRQ
jgi:hypothetical protein